MDIIYQFVELFVTFIEGATILSAITQMTEKRFSEKKNYMFIFLLGIAYTALVGYMNTWKIFSFLTIAIAIIFFIVSSKITSKGNILLRSTACIVTVFVFNTLDYILGYASAMILGHSIDIYNGLNILTQYGTTRIIYLFIVKFVQVGLYFVCMPLYPKIKNLSRRYLIFILSFSSIAYIIMSSVTALIMSESRIILQIAVILSLSFILLAIITAIVSIILSSQYHENKRENEMMILTNSLLERNYAQAQRDHERIRQQMHDFKNHIRTIDGLLKQDKHAKAYVAELLSTTYKKSTYCRSGNEVIDAIINCKQADSEIEHISFSCIIHLPESFHIAAIDICAILANQLDNAIEACTKIEEPDKRFIRVSIAAKESFVIFKVVNSAARNPFNDKHELITEKDNSDKIHGFGVKNIKETVSRYNGELLNSYDNGQFTSMAMISIS